MSETAGISSSAARATRSGIRHAPSRIEYSEWTWRWTKGASGMRSEQGTDRSRWPPPARCAQFAERPVPAPRGSRGRGELSSRSRPDRGGLTPRADVSGRPLRSEAFKPARRVRADLASVLRVAVSWCARLRPGSSPVPVRPSTLRLAGLAGGSCRALTGRRGRAAPDDGRLGLAGAPARGGRRRSSSAWPTRPAAPRRSRRRRPRLPLPVPRRRREHGPGLVDLEPGRLVRDAVRRRVVGGRRDPGLQLLPAPPVEARRLGRRAGRRPRPPRRPGDDEPPTGRTCVSSSSARDGAKTVVLHVEPDLWGYIEQAREGDDAATVPAVVPDGLPQNAAGFAQEFVHLRDELAPNVLLAYHLSGWGTEPRHRLREAAGRDGARLRDPLGRLLPLAPRALRRLLRGLLRP